VKYYLIGFFIFLFVIEKIFPLRTRQKSIVNRTIVNAAVSVLSYAAAYFFVVPMISLGRSHSPGWITNPLLAFLLFDSTFYYWHWLNHKVAVFWRFHNVHHSDLDLDVTTSFRFHFVEVAYSGIFRFLQAYLIGAPFEAFVLYQTVFQAATYFHHSNWRLPLPLEKILELVFVTPRMHGIHHVHTRAQTDSNYGVVFSFWDRLHGTKSAGFAQGTIGVPGYSTEADQKLYSLIAAPFRIQKKYWP
jgi:sterol desaturase/sphingolipid hydroxylase (fatty acid hydroxylase superfamily)